MLIVENPQFYVRYFSHRREIFAAAFTLPADSIFIIMLYLVYPDSVLPSILFIINFTMVLFALLGMSLKISPMIIPALVWKCGLLLFLLFLGCISVDAFQQIQSTTEQEAQINKSLSIWKEIAITYPLLPFITLACAFVLAIEARIFFSAWQKICCPSIINDESDLEKQPPSYSSCLRDPENGVQDLPSYEEALKKVAESSRSSTTSTTQSPVIYVIPDRNFQKVQHI